MNLLQKIKMTTTERILQEVTALKPIEQAQLVDNILSLLDKPNDEFDKLWGKEAESRLQAYKSGEIEAIPLAQVLARYK